MTKEISLKELLEAGCHFGHQVNKSNPRARDFVYTVRGGVEIIDLAKTKEGLEKAAEFLKNLAAVGGKIIFVGTKRQAKGVVSEEAKRAGVFSATERWVGGTITNWEEIKKNLEKMAELREELKNKEWTKKEKVLMERQLKKLETFYGGIEGLASLPDALFIVDCRKEEAAVREAQKKEVKIVGIVDTNTDPNLVDYPIPSNDDAVGAIQLITHFIAEAIVEGKRLGEKKEVKETKETKVVEKKKEIKRTKVKTEARGRKKEQKKK